MQTSLRTRITSIFKGTILPFGIALLVGMSVKSSLADWNDVPSGSMLPTILIGDRVYVNKLAYDLKVPFTTVHLAKWDDPIRGEIVVFFSPKDRTRMIKRVIGTPGDVIAMRNNKLYINDQFVSYSHISPNAASQFSFDEKEDHLYFRENLPEREHIVMISPTRPPFASFGPITIPEGKYFMMGDNRDNSADSRFFGLVDRNQIVGKATKVVISRDSSFLHPRWSRFFQELI